jgi:hypothetical protein
VLERAVKYFPFPSAEGRGRKAAAKPNCHSESTGRQRKKLLEVRSKAAPQLGSQHRVEGGVSQGIFFSTFKFFI